MFYEWYNVIVIIMENKNWYPLDNVSFLYATLKNKKRQNVFRFSCELADKIDKDYLQIALRETLKVYPNFHINLKTGFFTYFYETSLQEPLVVEETQPICHKLFYNDQDLLYEVNYYENRINFEVSHILSDSTYAMRFFKLLVSNYVKYYYNQTFTFDNATIELNNLANKAVVPNEKIAKLSNNYKNVYKYPVKKLRNSTRYYELHLNMNSMLNLVNKYSVDLPTFLISLMIFSMLPELKVKDRTKRIKIELPIELRTFSEANASQNCFDIFYIDFSPAENELQFQNILSQVDLQIKARSRDESGKVRNHLNVSFQRFISAKGAPLFIKKIGMGFIYKNVSKRRSAIYSNAGTLIFDDNIEQYVKSVSLLSSTSDLRFTLISNKNDLCIGISSVYMYNNIVRNFIKLLKDTDMEMYINTEVI